MNKKIFIVIIFFVIVGITVGYSSFNAITTIDDISAMVRIKKDIRVTDVSVSESYSGGVSNYEDYNVSSISSSVYLPNSDSTVTYKVEITNIESAVMGIYSVSGLPENLDYRFVNYDLKSKICDENNNCSLGISKDIYVIISYKGDGFDSNNKNYVFDLNFEFKQIHTISYVGLDDYSNYPTEVSDGEDINIVFENSIPDLITVTGSTNYSYKNNILNIIGVSEDIVINCNFLDNIDFGITDTGDGNTINIATDRVSPDNPVTVSNLLNMEFGGMNLTDKVITQIDVVLTYTTTTGSVQSFNCNLTVGGQKYTEVITILGKQNNATVKVSFTNLNIGINEEFVITNSNDDLNLTNTRITFNNMSITVILG